MAMNMITYSYELEQNKSVFGFKIMDQRDAKKYMSVVSKLSYNNIEFQFENNSYPYNIEYFENTKITASEVKVLKRLFDLVIDENESNVVGAFPDAMNDAYNQGLINDDQQIDQIQQDDDF